MRCQNRYFKSLKWVLSCLCLAACSTTTQTVTSVAQVEPGNSGPSAQISSGVIPLQSENSPRTARDIETLTIDDVIKLEEPNTQNLYDNSRYDFPITVNSRVEGWIDYFTGKGRGHMERYLSRSSRYMPLMKQLFKKAGLPEDLVYLALIESGFNLKAKSRAKAVGPWQFMKATGKRYGLRVDAWVDERRDPIRSTEAAANYLKDLYLMFESWYLAASAYNAGEYKVLRAIEETKTNNYWRICETKMLRRETKDYVPKLIAAAIIAKNPTKYGFSEVDYQEPLQFDTVQISTPAKLKAIAQLIHVPEEDMLELNPSFSRSITPPTGGPYDLRVPPGTKVLLERTLASNAPEIKATDLPAQVTVKSGETLKTIANRYKIALKSLAGFNNLSTKEEIKTGTTILLPKGTAPRPPTKVTLEEGQSRSPSSTTSTGDDYFMHTVKSGESLWSISEQYNVTVQNIFKWNGMTKSKIMPGKKLKIKMAKAQGTSHSSKPSSRRSS